jgi:hypothetical protein
VNGPQFSNMKPNATWQLSLNKSHLETRGVHYEMIKDKTHRKKIEDGSKQKNDIYIYIGTKVIFKSLKKHLMISFGISVCLRINRVSLISFP